VRGSRRWLNRKSQTEAKVWRKATIAHAVPIMPPAMTSQWWWTIKKFVNLGVSKTQAAGLTFVDGKSASDQYSPKDRNEEENHFPVRRVVCTHDL
jgi:hypothetical protein